MKSFIARVAVCAFWLACLSANAMPIGLRTLMHGRAAVRAMMPQTCNVTFDANGGLLSTDCLAIVVTNGLAYGELPTAEREGFSFNGWTSERDDDATIVDAATIVTNVSDFVLYALWTVNQYAVTFDANGGDGGWCLSLDYGTILAAPTVTREGYTFVVWSPDVGETVPAGDVTYTAQWKVNKYKVVFDATGGTGGTSVTQDYGTAIVAPTVTREGYTFVGWSPAVPATVPAGDVTYMAQWQINQYRVTFDATGGTGGTSVTQDYGTVIVAPEVSREGYTFVGWTPEVGETVPVGGAKYTAQWQINQYTVTFDATGGTGGTSVTQDYGTAIVVPTVTRTGYTFVGWSPEVDTTVPANDVTYTAQWRINQYTVTFDATGGTGGTSGTQDYGTAIVVPEVTREGYTFVSWTPDVDTAVPASNVTYMAQWQINANWIEIGTASKYDAEADGTVSLDLGECVESLSQPKITVKGLPTGLKFDAKTEVISGKATKPGVYKVTVSATNATVKKAVTATFDLVVPNLSSEVLPGLERDADAYVVTCGVEFDPRLVDCSPKKGWTVKVAGLPAGLKYDAKSGKITGVPTKAGTFTVTFTASKKGEKNQIATITLTTEALPPWAQGTFAGWAEVLSEPPCQDDYGLATMTVAANGKVSGKVSLGGTNWTFSAASYAMVNESAYIVEVVAKSGKATMPIALSVSSDNAPHGLANGIASGYFGDGTVTLLRNIWKDKATSAAAKSEIANWEGVYTVSFDDGGYVSLTVGNGGDVKASGKLFDGTAVSVTAPLMYHVCWDGFFTVLCASPSAYKGGFVILPVGFGSARGRLGEIGACPVLACSRNLQATGEYGEGFSRNLYFTGAYYDKAEKLNAYYKSLRFDTESPQLAYTFKRTYKDKSGKKVTESETLEAEAASTLGQDGLSVAINAKGTFDVAKVTKPVQDRITKEWSYNGVNDGALTLSFAQATGIFKGSYTFWYDYPSAFDETKPDGKQETWAHTSKKVSLEGIWVQGAESLRGFYLWDATGSYKDPKTGKPKTYKYKESHGVSLTP